MDAYARALEYFHDGYWDHDMENRFIELKSSQQRGVEPPECELSMPDHDLAMGLSPADREQLHSPWAALISDRGEHAVFGTAVRRDFLGFAR